MSFEESIEELQLEGTTPSIEFDIVDPETGVGFQPQDLRLTLWNAKDGAIVNGRSGSVILTSVDAQGHVKFWLTAADMAILDATMITEVRRALFTWSWLNGERHDGLEVKFTVYNHAKI